MKKIKKGFDFVKLLGSLVVKKFKKGFTLIELLVVIAIIGILATIVIVAISRPKEKADVASVRTTADSLTKYISLCADDPGSGILKPDTPKGGGQICTTKQDQNWPSLGSTGYVYYGANNYFSTEGSSDIDQYGYTFYLYKENNPVIKGTISEDHFPEVSTISESLPSPCDNYGDVDNDGKVTPKDAHLIKLIIINSYHPTPEEKLRGDLISLGSITGIDALYIELYLSKKISNFPVCGQ